MYNSFELFFFWRKCSTVVAVGVQTSFLLLCVDWLIDFFEEREKAMCQIVRGLQKVWQKKTTAGWIARRQAKRLCKPCTSTGSVAVRLNELARKGEDFCLAVIAPAELPVIIIQVKPDRFLPNSIPSWFSSYFSTEIDFYIWISENTSWLRSCGCGGHQSLCWKGLSRFCPATKLIFKNWFFLF